MRSFIDGRREWLILAGLFILALIPRLYRLDTAPPGLSGDEIFNALDALQIGRGNWPVFFPGNNGREPLFLYLIALSTRLLGESVVAIRLPAALLGAGSVVLAYLIGRDSFNRRVGFVGAALMAVSLWPLVQSHWALRAISLTFTTALAVWLYGRAARSGRRRDWLVAGLALGLTLYTYIPARIFPAVIIGWFLWLLVGRRGDWRDGWRKHGRSFLLSLTVALATMAPFLVYAASQPDEINRRVGAFDTALDQALAGDPTELAQSATAVLAMFTFDGDHEWRYHVAGRPVFDPVSGAFFYLGTAVAGWLALRRGEQSPDAAALLLWLAAMLGPVAILEANASFLRAAGAMVPVFLLAGLGFDAAASWAARRIPGRWTRALPVLVAAGLLLVLADAWRGYFGVWRTHPEVRHIYQAEMAEMARILADNPPPSGARVFVGYKYVLDYTTPRAYDFISDVPVSWFHYDEGFAWDGGPAWYLIPPSHSLPPAALERLTAVAESETVRYDDGETAFTRYRVPAEAIDWQPQHPVAVDFVDGPRLIGFGLPEPVYRGDAVPVTLHWQIPPGASGLPNELTRLHIALQDAGGSVWSEAEGLLDYPQASWRPGDRFVQRLLLPIPAGMPPGGAYLRFGLSDGEGQPYSATAVPPAGPFAVRSRPLANYAVQPETAVFDGALALHEATFSSLIEPGLPLDIALDWVALERPSQDYRARLELRRSGQDAPIQTQTFALWPEIYPPTVWAAGEQVTTLHRLDVPLTLPADGLELWLDVLPASGEGDIALTQGDGKLADLTVNVRQRLYEPPAIAQPLDDVQFADGIRLLGYELDEATAVPGGELRLTLYWQADERPSENYTVFTHLAGSDGQLWGQFDSPPVGEAWLTATWLPGEIVVDRRTVPIRPGAPPGVYRLLVGLYVDETRLPVSVGGAPQPGDQALLAEVSISTNE